MTGETEWKSLIDWLHSRSRSPDGRRAITIAHRLATVRRADVFFVLHDGVISERGTHEELLARNGLYARLHRMQFRHEEAVPA
jgi:ABC-type multidrug transport system fused ATPase/permease subunit